MGWSSKPSTVEKGRSSTARGLRGDIEGEEEEDEEEVEAVSTAGSASEALLLRKDDRRLISANGLRLLLGVFTGATVASEEEEEARRNLWPLVEVVEGDGAAPPPSLLAFLPRVSTWSESCRFFSPMCTCLPALCL